MREAGLSGSGSGLDEVVAREICDLILQNTQGRHLEQHNVKRRHIVGKSAPSVFQAEQAKGLQRGLRSLLRPSRVQQQMHRAKYAPSTLPEVCSGELQKKVRLQVDSSGRRVIEALPVYAMDARTARKNLAPSELRERLNEWLQSNDASEWRQSRTNLFGNVADDDGDGVT